MHAFAQKALVHAWCGQVLQPVFAHHDGGHRCVQARLFAQTHPVGQPCMQSLKQPLLGLLGRLEKTFQHGCQHRLPLGRCVGLAHGVAPIDQGLQPIEQAADQRCVQAAHPRRGHRVTPGLAPGVTEGVGATGVAQQQPAQAEGPGVVVCVRQIGRHAPLLAVLRVHAPANARCLQPIGQGGQVVAAQTKCLADGFDLEQGLPIAQAQPPLGPLHQWVQGQEPGVGGDRLIRHGIRQMQRLAHRGAAKNRMDVGREMGHVWHHDHDVARVQAGIVFEPAQHLIVQHFHLALGAVALHPLNAGVVGLALVLAFCRGAQVQDI